MIFFSRLFDGGVSDMGMPLSVCLMICQEPCFKSVKTTKCKSHDFVFFSIVKTISCNKIYKHYLFITCFAIIVIGFAI